MLSRPSDTASEEAVVVEGLGTDGLVVVARLIFASRSPLQLSVRYLRREILGNPSRADHSPAHQTSPTETSDGSPPGRQ